MNQHSLLTWLNAESPPPLPAWVVPVREIVISDQTAKMREKHPKWTERQCRCLLYWQPRSRKQMRQRVEEAMPLVGASVSAACPEAMGLNVFATARRSGLILDKPRAISTARHITLIGKSPT